MQQVAKVKRGRPRPFLRRRGVGVEPAPSLSLRPGHQRPADLLRVGEDASLDGSVLGGAGHNTKVNFYAASLN